MKRPLRDYRQGFPGFDPNGNDGGGDEQNNQPHSQSQNQVELELVDEVGNAPVGAIEEMAQQQNVAEVCECLTKWCKKVNILPSTGRIFRKYSWRF